MCGDDNGRNRVLGRLVRAMVAVCLLVAGAQALGVQRDQADLVRDADGIVLGTVTGVESGLAPDGSIETAAGVAVETAVTGTSPGDAVTVRLRGGTVDGVTQVVEDEPVLAPGDRAFLFLERTDAGYRVCGGRQGVVPVAADGVWVADGREGPHPVPAAAYGARLAALAEGREAPVLAGAASATAGGPVIASVSPSRAPAGTGATVTITGTGFGAKASRQSRADVGFTYRCTSPGTFVPVFATGRPYYAENENGIVSWSDTRVVVRVPAGRMSDGYDGSASSGRIWVVTDSGAASAPAPFAVTFGYGGRTWARTPTFVVNNNCPGVGDARSAVANAARTWSAALAGSSFRFVDGGPAASTSTGRDGRNLVCWKPPSDFADPRMVAVTDWWYVGPDLVECDVRLNTAFAWTTGTASGSTRSIEAVMLHEFGHWIGLRDLYGFEPGMPTDVGKVMFGSSNAAFGNLNRVALSPDDLAGARAIHGGAPAPAPGAVKVPGGGVPRDLDGDGRCEDLTANGRADFADVVLFFNTITWIAANEPVPLFDHNRNGKTDFPDVVWLSDHL